SDAFFRAVSFGNISYYAAPGTFVLSPETELVMTATAATSASTTTSAGDDLRDQAEARAYLQLSSIDPGQPSSGEIMASSADPFDGLPGDSSDSGTLAVSFSNTLASSTDGYYYAFVSIDAQSGTAPVPPPPVAEPEAL